MIELRDDALLLTSPGTHPDATASLEFQRTLRIPDDGRDYPLPAGLGRFPLRHTDDHDVPAEWRARGGVMLPMHQAEAMWIRFSGSYPWAIKVSAGKICAITGRPFDNQLTTSPARADQDYVVIPTQPWLDGFSVEKGLIRQFVAMPLGAGYTAEEQLTGTAEWGGVQIVAYPMKADRFEQLRAERTRTAMDHVAMPMAAGAPPAPAAAAMGLGAGGRMRQVIHEDRYGLDAWDTTARSRCFIHLCNTQVWRQMTGEECPTIPPTAKEYERAGLPWFTLYGEGASEAGGGRRLSKLKSVVQTALAKGDVPIADNAPVDPATVIHLHSQDPDKDSGEESGKGSVSDGAF